MHFHQWKRREVITLLGGAAMAWPLAARAQRADRMRRIGVITTYSDSEGAARAKALESGLQKFRWEQGRNIVLEYHFGVITPDQVATSVQQLVESQCDVILAHTPASLRALREATWTIPILFVQSSDPIQLGLVTSMASPEANITGFVAFEPSLGGKWLQMLSDAAPQLKKVLVLEGRDNPSSAGYIRSIEGVAPALGINVSTATVSEPEDIERSVSKLAGTMNVGLLVLPFPTMESARIVTAAAKYNLAAIYPFRYFVAAGGLMYYGPENIVDQWRQAASYIDRLFRGAQPRDLPVQLPTKFELVINLRTATSLGLTIPRDFLLIADEVIE